MILGSNITLLVDADGESSLKLMPLERTFRMCQPTEDLLRFLPGIFMVGTAKPLDDPRIPVIILVPDHGIVKAEEKSGRSSVVIQRLRSLEIILRQSILTLLLVTWESCVLATPS